MGKSETFLKLIFYRIICNKTAAEQIFAEVFCWWW